MASWSTEEIFKFIEMYEAENCLWDPKNENHKNKYHTSNAWKRISVTMGFPVHELKKKKENLLATFRINLKRLISSKTSGAREEDVFQPTWPYYDVLAAFLTDVYVSRGPNNLEEYEQPEEADSCNEVIFLPEVRKSDDDDDYDQINDDLDAEFQRIPKTNPQIQVRKRRVTNPPELQESSRKMSTASAALYNASTSNAIGNEEDECDLFCKMLAKQIRAYPKLEREEIMYELHGVMINRRRQYEKMQHSRNK